jgi:hypothetical protein
MKRRIKLYIGVQPFDVQADIGDETFILYNWSNGDFTDPAQIMNSWSSQATLPGTPNNDLIFGQMYRNDRSTDLSIDGGTKLYFDPTVRTPFRVLDDLGLLLEEGYVKLDQVVSNGERHEYKVTFYGGLGAFLQNLAFDPQGNRRSLAGLAYKSKSGTQQTLDFTISKETVKQAWDYLQNTYSPYNYLQNNKWDFINFAPAYNGYPKGSFSPDKAIIQPGVWVDQQAVNDGYDSRHGRILVTFSGPKTEWETRDLRSYLQRPVIRLMAIIQACADPLNNGGYTVDLDETFFDPALAGNKLYCGTWVTLPQLTQLDIQTGGTTGTFLIANCPTYSSLGAAAILQASINTKISPQSHPAGTKLYLHCETGGGGYYYNYQRVTVYGNISGSPSQVIATMTVATLAGYGADRVGYFDNNGFFVGDPLIVTWGVDSDFNGYESLTVQVQDVASVVDDDNPMISAVTDSYWTNPANYSSRNNFVNPSAAVTSGTYDTRISSSARSFLTVDHTLLLKTEHTPADYLLSFCKMFGLRLVYDSQQKKVTITTRPGYYSGRGAPIRLEQRINRSKPIIKTPIAFDSRWYALGLKTPEGEWAKYYENVYGNTYGRKRVDTGFRFNCDTREVLDTVLFKSFVQILESSQYYCRMVHYGNIVPGVFLDAGATYQLYDAAGKTVQLPIPYPNGGVYDYANPSHPTFDVFDKPQFHNADNESYDERDTLIFYEKMVDVTDKGYRLTDDDWKMMDLNGDTPCWNLTDGTLLTAIPKFTRYADWDGSQYMRTLDYAIPTDIPVPDLAFSPYATIYYTYWQRWIEDRLNVDTCILRCFVNFDGYQVSQELLRNYYYFDGALWSLNKIINYSLTTWEDTECEFIKVNDQNGV